MSAGEGAAPLRGGVRGQEVPNCHSLSSLEHENDRAGIYGTRGLLRWCFAGREEEKRDRQKEI